MFRKKFNISVCLILSLIIILTGCSGGAKKASSNVEKDTIVIGIPGEPPTLDPHMAADNIADGCICNQIFDELIRQDQDGKFSPGLAESWKIIDDEKDKITTVEFKLRKDVKFHNGDVLTAEDVVFSLNRAAESQFTQEITSALDHAEVINDSTVLAKFKYFYGPTEAVLSRIAIVNKKAVEADPEGFGRKPIGTGAYKFVELKSGDKIVCERFEDHYRGAAPIKNLVLRIMIDATTSALALEKGEVDLLAQPSTDDRQRLMDNEKIQYHEIELLGNNYIAFNNAKGLFADKKLRQAVAHAVDKESMLLGAVEGAGVIINNAIPRQSFGFSEDVKGYEYSIEKAKKLLADAGYKDGLSIQLKTMDSAVYSKPTEVLQDQLREIGIEAKVEKMERGAYLADVFTNAEYDITIMSWVYGLTDADAIYSIFHGNMAQGGDNFLKCSIPKLDELLDKGRSSTDQNERKKIYQEVSQLINDECVMVPLYAYMVGVAANKDLKGVKPSAIARYDAFNYSW